MEFIILIVDDEEGVCLSLSELLQSRGFTTCYETSPAKVLSILKSRPINLIMMDIRMPGIGGLDLLKLIKADFPDIPVLMVSGHATVDSAVRAMKYGAVNLYTKPIDMQELLKEVEYIRSLPAPPENYSDSRDEEIVSRNSEMMRVLSLVEKAAPTDATVLLTGESGTGKELVAKKLHQLSTRNGKPYIRLNCAAIPETLLESEMFGHEKGAFTDAHKQRKGIFEIASEGTILLDEIGDMGCRIQAKMLRVLQEKQFTRVGGAELLRTNCRVIAATNKNLEVEIATGSFRQDLYYRLSVINLHLPSLRERRDDIPVLLDHFRGYFSRLYSKEVVGFADQVRSMLLSHSWPGNVRELKNFVERAVIFSSGPIIQFSDLPDQYKHLSHDPADLSQQYAQRAREVILHALKISNGKKQAAAELLKIDRKTLYNRMKKLKII